MDDIKHDRGLLGQLDKYLFKLEKLLALSGGAVIFMLVLLTTVNVLGRWVIDLPVDGYVDWVEQCMAFIAFLGLSHVQRLGEHIRLDLLINRLSGRRLWLSELLTTVFMWLMSALLLYGSWLHFLRAYQLGDSSLDIELPTWPAKVVVPVALFVLLLRLSIQVYAYARAIAVNRSPVSVPELRDAVKDAAQRDIKQ